MEMIHSRCAGTDVHKDTVVACSRSIGPDGKAVKHVRTFATLPRDLLELSDWLAAEGVTPVAMESTGVYWKPAFHVLEGRLTTGLVNARHIEQGPGRKADVKDGRWIARLLQPGRLRPSSVPPRPTRERRDLTRHRARSVADKTAVADRIAKVLEDGDIELGSVATDLLGVSGRAMILAMIEGCEDPDRPAGPAVGRLRKKAGP
jgi:transposase